MFTKFAKQTLTLFPAPPENESMKRIRHIPILPTSKLEDSVALFRGDADTHCHDFLVHEILHRRKNGYAAVVSKSVSRGISSSAAMSRNILMRGFFVMPFSRAQRVAGRTPMRLARSFCLIPLSSLIRLICFMGNKLRYIALYVKHNRNIYRSIVIYSISP